MSPRKNDPPGLAARRGALHLVSAVLDRGRMLSEERLRLDEPAQRASARGLADLTLRRLGEIDALIADHVSRPPSAEAMNILRLLAAELRFAGTAPHAAVDSAVRLAKATPAARRLAGLINAVGRKLSAPAGTAKSPPEPLVNMPDWLARALIADWGEAATAAIAASHLTPAPHDLSPCDPAEVEALVQELGAERLPTGSLRLADRPQLTALPGYDEGRWWAQDAAAALPARLFGPLSGRRVLDLCAAPGGKTMQLAAMGAQITALDRSEARMSRLAENLARTGLAAETVVADALDWQPPAPFDAILVDAPCSATGTIRRHPDLPLRSGASEISRLIALQDRLLDRAFGWLAPGGGLVYATCSLLRAECEDRIERFLERTAEARLIPARDGVPDLPTEFVDERGCLRTRPDLWPERGGVDGFFAARVDRDA